jgi:uncharacterized protein
MTSPGNGHDGSAEVEMKMGISREEAVQWMEEFLKSDGLRKHSFASEVVMRAMALRLGHDPDLWGLIGLLHDIDYEETKDRPSEHGRKTADILTSRGVGKDVVEAIQAHNAEALGIERKSDVDYAITCSECVTGLVVATALVYPDKKLSSVKPSSVVKRMKQKEFARSVNRDHIRLCEKLNLSLDEFVELSVKAMAGISDQLGL